MDASCKNLCRNPEKGIQRGLGVPNGLAELASTWADWCFTPSTCTFLAGTLVLPGWRDDHHLQRLAHEEKEH